MPWRGSIFLSIAMLAVWIAGAGGRLIAEPTRAASSAYDVYCAQVEARLARQHGSSEILARGTVDRAGNGGRLLQGERIVEKLTPAEDGEFPGAMLHHWRGTAFAPGATAAEFERLMRDFGDYPRHFAPEVIRAKVLAADGDRMRAAMRVRQKHGITVVMDTDYEVVFGRPSAPADARRGWSISRSTRIAEIASPGTSAERALSPGEEHGFLWRLNTYWSYEERDGGLYLQIEAVSLTRSIPLGLGWAVGPFVESIPRESLEFTLRSACAALRGNGSPAGEEKRR